MTQYDAIDNPERKCPADNVKFRGSPAAVQVKATNVLCKIPQIFFL